MGWKMSTIFIMDNEFTNLPIDSPNNSTLSNVIAKEFWKNCQKEEVSSFDEGIFPASDNEIFIGSYHQCTIISSRKLLDDFLSNGDLCKIMINYFKNSKILALGLHSVVNYFAYAFFVNGERIRIKVGDASSGIKVDDGKYIDLENVLMEKCIMRQGRRLWEYDIHGKVEEFDEIAMGEEFVFELSKIVFGERIDQLDIWDLN